MALPPHMIGNAGTPRNDPNSAGLTFRGRTPRTSDLDARAQQVPQNGIEQSPSVAVPLSTSASSGNTPVQVPPRFSFGSEFSPASTPPEWRSPGDHMGNSTSSSQQSCYDGDKSKPLSARLRSSTANITYGPRSTIKSLFLGACLTATFFGILFGLGFFSPAGTADGQNHFQILKPSPKPRRRSLRGSGHGPIIILSQPLSSKDEVGAGGAAPLKIKPSAVDHHDARIIMVPSFGPFTRRNIHHYTKHDKQGRLIPPGAHRNDSQRVVDVDEAEDFLHERMAYVRQASDSLLHRIEDMAMDPDAMHPTTILPKEYLTTMESHHIHTITGIDESHQFDEHDYFGSAVTNMGTRDDVTTIAIGAPGSLDASGIIYFLSVHSDGEVESYTYIVPDEGIKNSKGEPLTRYWTTNSALGWSIENIGDLDGDGNPDLAVGALGYPHGSSKGSVFIFFLDKEFQVKSFEFLASGYGGFTPTLQQKALFGSSISKLGDVDGDGVVDLAVGAMGSGKERGAVYVLFMNKDGTVKKTTLISSLYGWTHKLNVKDQFGNAVRGLGDLDGDGVPDMVVSGDGFPSGEGFGALWVLFLKKDGTVKKYRRLDELDAVLEEEALLGASIDSLGDLDGDGLPEILVGAPGVSNLRGEAYMISFNKEGKVKHYKGLVEDDQHLSGLISENHEFGWSICNLGDINGDGTPDIAIAAETSPGFNNHPSIHIYFTESQDFQEVPK